MELYFRNSRGQTNKIADCDTPAEVGAAIRNFIDEWNERRRGVSKFISYYTRIWKENDMIVYDVGSHSEFFLWRVGDLTVEELYNKNE